MENYKTLQQPFREMYHTPVIQHIVHLSILSYMVLQIKYYFNIETVQYLSIFFDLQPHIFTNNKKKASFHIKLL